MVASSHDTARSGPSGRDHAGDARAWRSARASTPEFIRDEVARGRLVIPANVRHLAGSGGAAPDAGERPSAELPGDAARPSRARRRALLGEPDGRAALDDDRRPAAPARRAGAEAPRPDRHRAHDHHQDQRQHRRLAGVRAAPTEEVEKLRWAQRYGADTLMDLSTGGDLDECRQAIIDHAPSRSARCRSTA